MHVTPRGRSDRDASDSRRMYISCRTCRRSRSPGARSLAATYRMNGPRSWVERQPVHPAARLVEPDHIARRRLDDEEAALCRGQPVRSALVEVDPSVARAHNRSSFPGSRSAGSGRPSTFEASVRMRPGPMHLRPPEESQGLQRTGPRASDTMLVLTRWAYVFVS